METMRIRRTKIAGDDQASDVLVKPGVEWLTKETHASTLTNPKLELEEELLRSIKTEHDYHIDAETHVVQGFTPVYQTDEYIKTELVLDEEFIDNDQLVGDGISDGNCETSYPAAHSDAPARLRRGPKRRTHLEREGKSEFCARTSKTKYDLHPRSHGKFKTHFVCEVCGCRFKENANLNWHMRRKHLDKAQLITPGLQTTGDHSVNTNEILRNTPTSQPTFKCGICLRSCKTKSTLKSHLKTHLEDRKREFACNLCETTRSFSKIVYLKRHILTHDKDRKREFSCKSCGKAFYTNGSLMQHIKIHAGETFDCEVCGKNYTQKQNLKLHMRRKHSGENEQESPGPQTSNETSEHSDYKHHSTSDPLTSIDASIHYENSGPKTSNEASIPMKDEFMSDEELLGDIDIAEETEVYGPSRNIHPKDSMAQEEGIFNCELCPRSFLRPENLKRHMCTHTKDDKRKFGCQLCECTFFNTAQLAGHMKFHSSETYCEVCGYRFTQKQNLKMHVLRCKQLQQNDQGPDTSNDASVHLKTEFLSDEETLAQDETT